MTGAAARASERRTRERRSARRSAQPEESWFGAFGPSSYMPGSRDDANDDVSRFDNGLQGPAPETLDSRYMSRQAARVVEAGQTAFERIYRTFITARVALGIALLLAIGLAGLLGPLPSLAVAAVSLAYAALTLGMWLWPRFQRGAAPRPLVRLRGVQWLATIGIDIVCFTALHLLAPGSNLNYVALLVLPVLMAGVLTPRKMALATAAVVSLELLGTAWLSVLAGGGDWAQAMTQAGLAGSGFFVITVLAGELAGRLAREELAARGSLQLARQQAQLNRLVIEEMQDGVLVVDRGGRVRAANPSARKLLVPTGMSRPAPFQLRGVGAFEALVKAVERAFAEATWPEAGRDVVLQFAPGSMNDLGQQRTLRVRVRFTRKREPTSAEEYCVMFLEDVRSMQARSRQEKLAAMGRVSAGIAHEIRNPLAAISQANALLFEDATDPGQLRLMRMVNDNVERLKRIVDDVMEVAPGTVHHASVIDAEAVVAATTGEWAHAVGLELGDHSVLRVELPAAPLGVLFDAEHLRRVLVNLLDNALRHASKAPGAIHLRLDSRHEGHAFLSIASDGAPIPPDVEPYLFEPFFSTRSRGTGLGLYICRELCERYGASIDYRLRDPEDARRNEFFVDMQRRALDNPESRLQQTP